MIPVGLVAGDMLKVNLGSGAVAPDGWVNIDRSPGVLLSRVPGLLPTLGRLRVIPQEQATAAWPRTVKCYDVLRGLPFDSGSVDAVYSSHMLEHLPHASARRVLYECRRVLKEEGVLRLSVPNLRTLAATYVASPDPDAADTFMQETGMAVEQPSRGIKRLVNAVGAVKHLYLYDDRTLPAMCREAGFSTAEVVGFRQGRCPDLDTIETRDGSLFVEAFPTADG